MNMVTALHQKNTQGNSIICIFNEL